jgi:SAM-dependent methyltransferase
MFNLKNFFQKEAFMPSFLSLLFNPFYLIRSGIYAHLKSKSVSFTGKILDFGCGSKPYRELFPNVTEYIGVDYEPIEVSKNPSIDIFYNGKTLPFPDNHFDGILCTEVVEHLFNIEELLPELYRVLKKDGVGLFTFPFAWPEHAQPWDFARYTSFSSKFIFEKYKFQIENYEKSGHYIEVIHQFMIFYIFTIIPGNNAKLKMLIMLPFTIFFNLSAKIFSLVLPKQADLYFNNILLVKK